MSTAARRTQAAPAEATEELYRFSVPQYMKLVGEGIFGYDTRTELIDGLVIRRMPRNPPHDGTLAFLNHWLVRLLPDEWAVRCQLTLMLSRSVPEPDLLIARGPATRYRQQHPRAADTVLVIEVADDTLATDRNRKGPAYARARLPEYWIVNVVDRQVEVYTQPRGGRSPGYRQRRDFTVGATVPLVLGGETIGQLPIADVFAGLLPE